MVLSNGTGFHNPGSRVDFSYKNALVKSLLSDFLKNVFDILKGIVSDSFLNLEKDLYTKIPELTEFLNLVITENSRCNFLGMARVKPNI